MFYDRHHRSRAIALAIAGFLIYASTAAGHVPRHAHRAHQRAGGDDLPADQRLPELDAVVALRAPRSGAEAHLLRRAERAAARSMRGRATRMSAPGAWRSSTRTPNKIIIKLDFFKPFKANNIAEFTLEPKGGATDVTWAMHGPVPFIGKIMHLIIELRQNGRQGFRRRPRQHEGRGRAQGLQSAPRDKEQNNENRDLHLLHRPMSRSDEVLREGAGRKDRGDDDLRRLAGRPAQPARDGAQGHPCPPHGRRRGADGLRRPGSARSARASRSRCRSTRWRKWTGCSTRSAKAAR